MGNARKYFLLSLFIKNLLRECKFLHDIGFHNVQMENLGFRPVMAGVKKDIFITVFKKSTIFIRNKSFYDLMTCWRLVSKSLNPGD